MNAFRTVPQNRRMSKGITRRKINLAEYGFRLPSCIDKPAVAFQQWDANATQDGERVGDAGPNGRGADRRLCSANMGASRFPPGLIDRR